MAIKYRKFIEKRFLIDEPETGKLVPFVFRKVQNKYYDELIRDYDIENKGLTAPVREIILKARREGFSSLILALFAADDILQENPTETLVVSYKEEATKTFRKRYRLYVTSYFAVEMGFTFEDVRTNPSLLDEAASQNLSIDGKDIELRHNRAHFYCGTASARTGGRGGVLQKVLFSEEAHYPVSEDGMSGQEIIDGTIRQIDIKAGWIFRETTANGYGNYYEQTWTLAVKGESRFKPRFYGWREMYSDADFKLIASEFTDKAMLKQEYPETPQEAFISSGSAYFDNERILEMIKKAVPPKEVGVLELECEHPEKCKHMSTCELKKPVFTAVAEGTFKIWERPKPYHSYILSADVSEGVNGDYSVGKVIDAKTLKTVAKFKDKLCPPDDFALVLYAMGVWYNFAYTGVEANKDGLWVNSELFKMEYPNLYYREQLDDITNKVNRKIGFKTDEKTRPYILSELRKMLAAYDDTWNDVEFLEECLVFVRGKSGKAEAMSGKHDDEVIATAIGLEIRRNAPEAFDEPKQVPQNSQSYVMARLEKIKASKRPSGVPSQSDYI